MRNPFYRTTNNAFVYGICSILDGLTCMLSLGFIGGNFRMDYVEYKTRQKFARIKLKSNGQTVDKSV